MDALANNKDPDEMLQNASFHQLIKKTQSSEADLILSWTNCFCHEVNNMPKWIQTKLYTICSSHQLR